MPWKARVIDRYIRLAETFYTVNIPCGYFIRQDAGEMVGMGRVGKIYNSVQNFREENDSPVCKIGYIVFDVDTGEIPEGCNLWNDTLEEAISNY